MSQHHATPVVPSAAVRTSQTPAPRSGKWKAFLSTIAMAGPAFIAGAWQFGPGNLASAVEAGSKYSYSLIWVIVLSTVFMLVYADMSVRLGIRTPKSMISSVKDVLGQKVGVAAGFGVFIITLCFSVGNAVGSGLGLSMVFGGSPLIWTIACTVFVALILLFRNVYRVVERVLLVIVGLLGAAFVISAVIAKPDWYTAVSGVVPTAPPGSLLLIVALVGTNFSLNAAFFTSYGIHERGRTRAEYRQTSIADTVPGIVAPGIMTALVIVVAAAVLGRQDTEAATLVGLAKIFEPIAGPVGSTIFALGLSGAAFSSMVANATAGGTMLSDALGRGASPSTPTAKMTCAAILAFGLAITIMFTSSPIQLIIVAQALTVLVAPFLGFLIYVMSNNRQLMGDLRNTWWKNALGVLGFLSILSLSGLLIYELATR
ncbi:Divalent metal cation transporter MntH [Rhodococcus fascians]|jgi:manganese transport protein|nr:Divalent metal cation transporter MntH [Rhodococcus fascians D188]NIL90620.1 Divalent metal cation transporter MntH [Rhodococcus fascians]